jgi:hypothetical protein
MAKKTSDLEPLSLHEQVQAFKREEPVQSTQHEGADPHQRRSHGRRVRHVCADVRERGARHVARRRVMPSRNIF